MIVSHRNVHALIGILARKSKTPALAVRSCDPGQLNGGKYSKTRNLINQLFHSSNQSIPFHSFAHSFFHSRGAWLCFIQLVLNQNIPSQFNQLIQRERRAPRDGEPHGRPPIQSGKKETRKERHRQTGREGNSTFLPVRPESKCDKRALMLIISGLDFLSLPSALTPPPLPPPSCPLVAAESQPKKMERNQTGAGALPGAAL